MLQAREPSPIIPAGDAKPLRPTGVLCHPADLTAPESGPGDVLGAQHAGAERKSTMLGRMPGTARKLASAPAPSWLKSRAKRQLPSSSGSSLFHPPVPLSVVSDPFPACKLPPASAGVSTYAGHEGQAAEKDTDFQARVHPLFFQVCKAAPGQQQRQQKGADEEKIHVSHHSLEQNGPTKPMTSAETYQREKSHEPLGTDGTSPSAPGSLPTSPLSLHGV